MIIHSYWGSSSKIGWTLRTVRSTHQTPMVYHHFHFLNGHWAYCITRCNPCSNTHTRPLPSHHRVLRRHPLHSRTGHSRRSHRSHHSHSHRSHGSHRSHSSHRAHGSRHFGLVPGQAAPFLSEFSVLEFSGVSKFVVPDWHIRIMSRI